MTKGITSAPPTCKSIYFFLNRKYTPKNKEAFHLPGVTADPDAGAWLVVLLLEAAGAAAGGHTLSLVQEGALVALTAWVTLVHTLSGHDGVEGATCLGAFRGALRVVHTSRAGLGCKRNVRSVTMDWSIW